MSCLHDMQCAKTKRQSSFYVLSGAHLNQKKILFFFFLRIKCSQIQTFIIFSSSSSSSNEDDEDGINASKSLLQIIRQEFFSFLFNPNNMFFHKFFLICWRFIVVWLQALWFQVSEGDSMRKGKWFVKICAFLIFVLILYEVNIVDRLFGKWELGNKFGKFSMVVNKLKHKKRARTLRSCCVSAAFEHAHESESNANDSKKLWISLSKKLNAFYLFTRPHTILGTVSFHKFSEFLRVFYCVLNGLNVLNYLDCRHNISVSSPIRECCWFFSDILNWID